MSKPSAVLRTTLTVFPEGISVGYARTNDKQLSLVLKWRTFGFLFMLSRRRYLIAINTTLSNENIHLGYLSLGISSTLVSFAVKPRNGLFYMGSLWLFINVQAFSGPLDNAYGFARVKAKQLALVSKRRTFGFFIYIQADVGALHIDSGFVRQKAKKLAFF